MLRDCCSNFSLTLGARIAEIPPLVIHSYGFNLVFGERDFVISADLDNAALTRGDLLECFSIFQSN